MLPASFSRRSDSQRTTGVRPKSWLAAAFSDQAHVGASRGRVGEKVNSFDRPLCKSVHCAKLSARLTGPQGLRVFSQFSQHHL